MRPSLMRLSLPANILGAFVTFAYFRFVDPMVIATGRRPDVREIIFLLSRPPC